MDPLRLEELRLVRNMLLERENVAQRTWMRRGECGDCVGDLREARRMLEAVIEAEAK